MQADEPQPNKDQDQPAVSLDVNSKAKSAPPDPLDSHPGILQPKSPGSGNKSMVIVALLILVVLVAISSFFAFHTKPKKTVTATTSTTAVKPAPAAVSITSTDFSPATITIKVGQAVVWTNSDTASHLVVSTNPKPVFGSQEALAQNDSYSYVFAKAGTYPYKDTTSPTLKGVVIVK